MKDNEKVELILSLLSDLNQEVISRREPEHLYTSAYIASSGAVIWGIATLKALEKLQLFYPTLASITFILLLGFFICFKIMREYKQYKKARKEQGRIISILIKEFCVNEEFIPKGIVNSKPQRGHLFSIFIVISAGISSAIFCVAVYFS